MEMKAFATEELLGGPNWCQIHTQKTRILLHYAIKTAFERTQLHHFIIISFLLICISHDLL